MPLTDLALPVIMDTSSADLDRDLFVPALQESIRYDRGVGFFSSTWLRVAARGMVAFANHHGRARWITSPILTMADWEAMHTGDAAHDNPALKAALDRSIEDLSRSLHQDTLTALAWMIADDIITFKLALPCNKLADGDFHTKFGVFTDALGNQVAFNGSYNDSIQGLRNYESIMIFASWERLFQPLVQENLDRFQRLWHNKDPNVRVYDLPEAARNKILQLRTTERPYSKPDWVDAGRVHETTVNYQTAGPALPAGLTLRAYQMEAINAWLSADACGLFEMATGTGKTITALAASLELRKREQRLLIVICCPYTHLVNQWGSVTGNFGYRTISTVAGGRPWPDRIANHLIDLADGYMDSLVILTTYDTFSSQQFIDLISARPVTTLLIADEAHEAATPKRSQGLLQSYRYRLGLSATPRRWFDDDGTAALFGYFGHTVAEFPLAKAIPEFLTPYDYYPVFVELTEEEFKEYRRLTRQISSKTTDETAPADPEALKLYYILRKQIVVNAAAKYEALSDVLDRIQPSRNALVYCSPEQIDNTQAILNSRGIIQSRFTAEESLRERETILQDFASGLIQMLVAMKCLDQGVDVPSTRTAILLASSTNPKEFIQRRGRVLRKWPGKEKATIYDIIVVPTLQGNIDERSLNMERQILRTELARYDEFASMALNRIHALNLIGPVKRKYLLV